MSHRERMRQRRKKNGTEESAASDSQTRPSIKLRIDELVLSGADFTARERIADAVQSDLANMLSERGLPQHPTAPAAREWIDAGTITLRRGTPAQQIGGDIARAVHDGLSAGNKPVAGKVNKT